MSHSRPSVTTFPASRPVEGRGPLGPTIRTATATETLSRRASAHNGTTLDLLARRRISVGRKAVSGADSRSSRGAARSGSARGAVVVTMRRAPWLRDEPKLGGTQGVLHA